MFLFGKHSKAYFVAAIAATTMGRRSGAVGIFGSNNGAEVEPGTYTASYQANWQLALDVTTCGGDYATKRLSCLNDGTITVLETLLEDVECEAVNASVVECKDTTETFVNGFSGVSFECESVDQLPEARVEYLSAPALCQVGDGAESVTHMVQLGLACEVDTVNYDLGLTNCGEDNTQETESLRATCMAEQVFDATNSGETVDMDIVSVQTDLLGNYDDVADSCIVLIGAEGGEDGEDDCEGGGVVTVGGIGLNLGGSGCNEDEDEPVLAEEEPTDGSTAGTIYSVDYKTRFKRVVDDGCSTVETDTFQLSCLSGQLTLTNVPEWIYCTDPEDYENSLTGQYSLCVTCEGEECEQKYIDRNSRWILGRWIMDESIIVEIEFTCSGTTVDDVGAFVSYYGTELTGESGRCSGNGASDNNVLIAQLDVSCPDESAESSYTFVNDDAYVECETGVSVTIDGNYTCGTGDHCKGDACLVEYTNVDLQADHYRFYKCIQTDNDSPVPLPDELYAIEEDMENAVGQYTARFQLGSAVFADEDACSVAKTSIKITCEDGTINLIESDPDKNCEVVGDNEVECTETALGLSNEFVDVATYECTGNAGPPHTKAEYVQTEVECDSNSDERAARYLNLGIYCGDPGDEEFLSLDHMLECAEDNSFSLTTDDIRFSCASAVIIERASVGAMVLPAAEIFTDHRWKYITTDICYSFKPGSSASSVSKSTKQLTQETPYTKTKNGSNATSTSIASNETDNGDNDESQSMDSAGLLFSAATAHYGGVSILAALAILLAQAI